MVSIFERKNEIVFFRGGRDRLLKGMTLKMANYIENRIVFVVRLLSLKAKLPVDMEKIISQ